MFELIIRKPTLICIVYKKEAFGIEIIFSWKKYLLIIYGNKYFTVIGTCIFVF